MKNGQRKPHFELARALQESSEAPQVFTVDGGEPQSLDRRKFLSLGAGVPAAVALAAFWSERAAAADAVIVAHKSAVSFLGIPPEGSMLLSAAREGLKKWTLPDGVLDEVLDLDGPFAAQHGRLQLSPQGKILMSVSALGVWLYTHSGGKPIDYLSSDGAMWPSPAAAISPDENWLAVTDGSQIFFSPMSGQRYKNLHVQRTIEGRSDRITHLAIRGSLLISGSQDGRVCSWSFPGGAPRHEFETGSRITSMLAIAEPLAIATGHADGSVRLTSLSDGKTIFDASAGSMVQVLEPGPESGLLVSGATNGLVDVWSLEKGEHLVNKKVEFSGDTFTQYAAASYGSLTALAVSAKAGVLAVGGSSGQIVLLNWPSLDIRTHLFDRSATPVDAKGVSYTVLDRTTGRTVTYTLPCGSTIPPGAVCVCNCVPGAAAPRYVPPARTTPSYVPAPSYSPPATVPGGTITRPCTPTPVPEGYVCTCNCIPGR